MLKITNIIPGAPADTGKINAGDRLLSINGVEIRDFIDYRYAEAEEKVILTLLRSGKPYKVTITKPIDQTLGLEFEPDRIIRCRNKCIFCFCNNNPRQLRRSLYIKDDDYRYSFFHGSFVTLTNLSEDDIQRIIKLRLSPLYISVQATDDNVRKVLFGRTNVPPVMPLLTRLAENGIDFHCQVVVVPGYNDGDILNKTAADLASLRPHAISIAVVPVGLTDFSNPILKPVSVKKAMELINTTANFRRRYGDKHNHFAYAADELFIKAGLAIPRESYYDDFPQIENGIGMTRDFLDTIPNRPPRTIPGYWVTGQSMIKVWRKYIIAKYNLKMRMIPITNGLFGPRVTVTGLLPGKDILATLKKKKLSGGPVIIPPNCLNHDGLFIDDLTIADLKYALNTEVIQGSYSFQETLRMIA
jgi:putative radical SAM enzyme (TIGR03279 family)